MTTGFKMRRAMPGLVLAVALGLAGAPSQALAQTPTTPQSGVSAYLVVLAGRLNVRGRPSLDAPVVGLLRRGQRLCVQRFEGDWAEVFTFATGDAESGPVRGYVSRGFVSETRAERAELQELGCLG